MQQRNRAKGMAAGLASWPDTCTPSLPARLAQAVLSNSPTNATAGTQKSAPVGGTESAPGNSAAAWRSASGIALATATVAGLLLV